MSLRFTGLLALVAALAVVATASADPGTTQLQGSLTSLPDEVIGSVDPQGSRRTAWRWWPQNCP